MVKKIIPLMLGLFNLTSHAQIEFAHKWNDWATHQPVLYTIAMSTTGPIIEFGCGDSSTGLLHEICKKNKRLLISIDDNLEWLNKFALKYKDDSAWHQFFFVPDKANNVDASHWIKFLDNFELLRTVQFDLCFVDQSPWQARTETILRLKDKVKFIILHDCDCLANILGTTIQVLDPKNYIPGIYDFSNIFKYFKVYFPLAPWPGQSGPPTLLGSNIESNLPSVNYENY